MLKNMISSIDSLAKEPHDSLSHSFGFTVNENVFQNGNSRPLERLSIRHNVFHQSIIGLHACSVNSEDLDESSRVNDA